MDGTKDDDHQNARILHWVKTWEHKIEGDYRKSRIGSTLPNEADEEDNSTEPLLDANELVGCDDDVLIPSREEINWAFLECQTIWSAYISTATSLPLSWIPAPNPHALLQRVPPLPQNLPKARAIAGQSLWHVPCPELSDTLAYTDDAVWSPEHVNGPKKVFPLFVSKPTECHLSSQTSFSCFTTSACPEQSSNGIAILTICWSYIFSARFLEMQKRRMKYSLSKLSPVLQRDIKAGAGRIVLCFDHASNDLVRWMCALLVPGLGWLVEGPLPPWAAHYHTGVNFIITVNSPFTFHRDERPPSSARALDLLIEFCTLFNFGSYALGVGESFRKLDQLTAGFLSALMLPFSNYMCLQPQLPQPTIRCSHYQPRLKHIRELFDSIPFYMTLVIRPSTVGSIIWSIFWQSGIQCNLASAWLGSVREVLRPLIEAGNWEMLAKVFILRDPRRGSLWLGLFLHGDMKVFDMLVSYLESHEERYGFASLSKPDADVAQWTGLPQSFIDEDTLGTYEERDTQVPMCDLFRHRFNLQLRDPEPIPFGWQPFGHMCLKDIEPELWPRLEQRQPRSYIHWIWWLKDKDGLMIPEVQLGFRREGSTRTQCQGRHERLPVVIPAGFSCKVKLKPSALATRQMVIYGFNGVVGNRTPIVEYRKYPWLNGIRRHLL